MAMSPPSRTVIFLEGPTASGKSTSSRVLGPALGIPVVKADHVYEALKERFNVPVDVEEIWDFEKWDDPRNFGIESWGAHASIHEAKVEGYAAVLKDVGSSSLIIEGWTVAFALERLIVRTLLQPSRSIVVRLELDHALWTQQYEHKYGTTFGRDHREMARAHASLSSLFERLDGEVVLSCATRDEACSPAMVDVLSALI